MGTPIRFKLKIFISSKCGGKYEYVRKGLKLLLESTGLANVFVYEDELASSQDNISSYLTSLDDSNLCIFIIDNEDWNKNGASAAVLSEEKRAKEKNLRLLYFFCDEGDKSPTAVQQEVKVSQLGRYKVAHKFSDVMDLAYSSVIQDIIDIYKNKSDLPKIASEEERALPKKTDTASSDFTDSHSPEPKLVVAPSGYKISKSKFNFPKASNSIVKDFFGYRDDKIKEPLSDLDALLYEQFMFAIGRLSYSEERILALKEAIIQYQVPEFSKFLGLRFDAQLLYYTDNFDAAIDKLQLAMAEALSNDAIPLWLVNDIAIDIRNVYTESGERKNIIYIDNPGQKIIDESEETVYYPSLDREIENAYESIIKEQFEVSYLPPHTIRYGGSDCGLSNIFNAFCIAQFHGSLTNTLCTKNRLEDVFLALCTSRKLHNSYVDLLRILFVNLNNQKLKKLLTPEFALPYEINQTDIAYVLSDINNIPSDYKKSKATLLLFAYLGYNMDDETFSKGSSELFDYSITWCKSSESVTFIGEQIILFYKKTFRRLAPSKLYEFISAIFSNKKARFYHDTITLMSMIDYTTFPDAEKRKVENLIVALLNGTIDSEGSMSLQPTEERFAVCADPVSEHLDQTIRDYLPDYYNRFYSIEIKATTLDDYITHINHYIELAKKQNLEQGKDGVYHGYSYNPHDLLRYIASKPIVLNHDTLSSIIESALDTLSFDTQTYKAKICAINLLTVLYAKYPDDENWNSVKSSLSEKASGYICGRGIFEGSEGSQGSLRLAYNLFLYKLSMLNADTVLNDLFSVMEYSNDSLLRALDIVLDFLEDMDLNHCDSKIILTILNLCIFVFKQGFTNASRTVALCLAKISSHHEYGHISLRNLSAMMEICTPSAKTAILSRITALDISDRSYTEHLLKKGMADSNYLVRLVANREYLKFTETHPSPLLIPTVDQAPVS